MGLFAGKIVELLLSITSLSPASTKSNPVVSYILKLLSKTGASPVFK
jgi:hypothetical protein